jgi:hypothetical protein
MVYERMKIRSIFHLFLVFLFISCAARPEKFFPTGTMWQEQFFLDEGRGYESVGNPRTFYVGEDTLINHCTYKSIWIEGKNSGMWVREEGKKVWLLRSDCPEELLLYDFNWDAEKGTARQYYKEGKGVKTDSIPISSIYKAQLEDGRMYNYIEYRESYTQARMIEGIGRTSDPIKDASIIGSYEPASDWILPMIGEWRLLYFKRNGKVIYKNKE